MQRIARSDLCGRVGSCRTATTVIGDVAWIDGGVGLGADDISHEQGNNRLHADGRRNAWRRRGCHGWRVENVRRNVLKIRLVQIGFYFLNIERELFDRPHRIGSQVGDGLVLGVVRPGVDLRCAGVVCIRSTVAGGTHGRRRIDRRGRMDRCVGLAQQRGRGQTGVCQHHGWWCVARGGQPGTNQQQLCAGLERDQQINVGDADGLDIGLSNALQDVPPR